MSLSRIARPVIGALCAVVAMAAPRAGLACGPKSDCAIGDRSYRVVLPDRAPSGAIVYVHGYRGTAARAIGTPALTGLARNLGVALVAAQAAGPEWNIPGVPSVDARDGVDELAYFDALSADLRDRFGVGPERTLVAGFSSGAMMVWHLACQRGDGFLGYVPMSGTFWQPVPQRCPAGPANLIHYHGTEDRVVPLAGRQIKDGHQGDVHAALAAMSRSGSYGPAAAAPEAGLDCARQRDDAGHRLELCLFAGKHEMRAAHIRRAWRAFTGG